ncbi:MAG TPA: 30S ribosomal protein S3 [Candidatus Ornithoclostridium excrementipullorum]|nr:30S ribosomal protein S3 [Candidatus Ornithoclostridium excrementipullorum]
MGQKVSPKGMRVGVIKGWDAQWYADKKNFADYLIEDHKIREFIKKKYYECSISRISISRISSVGIITVNIYTSKPAVLIGKQGSGVDQMTKEISALVKSKEVSINVYEVKRPDVDAQLVAENIAAQLEKRFSFRRAMKQAIGRAMKAGAKGVKVMVSGRLDGAEIARSEKYHEGSIPLQTLRADIDYGFAEAKTTFGIIGVKTWIYKGEVLGKPAAGSEGGNA